MQILNPLKWLSDLTQMYKVNGEDLGESFVFQKLLKSQLLSTLKTMDDLLDDASRYGE